jgi:endonuclease/exonuclease/phosphatase family metal-dependent hydrolase
MAFTLLCAATGCASEAIFFENPNCCQEFDGEVRVMTLNLAHGRGTALHQAAVSSRQIRANLDEVAELIVEEDSDVIGLQEADGSSAWSGNFDHVAYLADAIGFPWYVRGGHAALPSLDYGTAILGRPAVVDSDAVNFDTLGPGFHKGYTVSTITLDGVEVDVLSIHLDPLLGGRRKGQVRQIAEYLEERGRPAIIMGDFNVSWREGNPVHWLMERLDLEAYEPGSGKHDTFKDRRLDWVLITEDVLDFENHWVIHTDVSDHRPVVADIVLE